MTSAASRFATAKTRTGSSHINPGAGVLIIKSIKYGTAPEFSSGETFVVEAQVASCEPYKGLLDENGKEKPAGNPIGATIGWVKTVGNFVGGDTMFWDDVYTFIMTALGENDSTLAAAAEETNQTIKKDPAVKRQLEEEIGGLVKGDWGANHQAALIFARATNRQDNPLAGTRIGYATYEKKSKSTGKLLTLVNWNHIEQTPEEIEASKALLK